MGPFVSVTMPMPGYNMYAKLLLPIDAMHVYDEHKWVWNPLQNDAYNTLHESFRNQAHLTGDNENIAKIDAIHGAPFAVWDLRPCLRSFQV